MVDYHQPESGTHTQVIVGGIRAWANYPDTVFGLFMWEDWHLEPQAIQGSQSLNYHLYNESSAGYPGYIFVTICGNSNWNNASTHQGIFCWSDWNDAASKNHTSSQLLNYHYVRSNIRGLFSGSSWIEVEMNKRFNHAGMYTSNMDSDIHSNTGSHALILIIIIQILIYLKIVVLKY